MSSETAWATLRPCLKNKQAKNKTARRNIYRGYRCHDCSYHSKKIGFINILLSWPCLPTPTLHLILSSIYLPQLPGEDSQKELPSPSISCPMGSKSYHSHCYVLVMTSKSWYQADVSAEKWGWRERQKVWLDDRRGLKFPWSHRAQNYYYFLYVIFLLANIYPPLTNEVSISLILPLI